MCVHVASCQHPRRASRVTNAQRRIPPPPPVEKNLRAPLTSLSSDDAQLGCLGHGRGVARR
eukprot:7510573-Pyramimonas_sp.AAC.1